MRSVLALLALFVCFGVACGDEGEKAEEELSGAARYAEEKSLYWRIFCTCSAGETEVQPADSPCVLTYLGSQSACEEEVLEEQWDDLAESGECLINVYEEGQECLRESCGVQQCLLNIRAASERCPVAARDAFTAACNSQ